MTLKKNSKNRKNWSRKSIELLLHTATPMAIQCHWNTFFEPVFAMEWALSWTNFLLNKMNTPKKCFSPIFNSCFETRNPNQKPVFTFTTLSNALIEVDTSVFFPSRQSDYPLFSMFIRKNMGNCTHSIVVQIKANINLHIFGRNGTHK